MRALAVLFSNLARLLLLPVRWPIRTWQRRRVRWVRLELHGQLSQLPRPVPVLARLLRRRMPPGPTPLSELRDLAHAMSEDPGVEGLLVSMPRLTAGWSACEDLREVFGALRAAGKRVVVHLPEGGGHREMLVASAADEVLLSAPAQLHLVGISAQTAYLGGLLTRLGVRAEVQAVGDYKTAGERFERAEMSDAQREQLTALLGTVQVRLQSALGERPLKVPVESVFERALWPASDAVEAGLVDGLAYEDGLASRLGYAGARRPMAAAAYLAAARARVWHPLRTPPYIAVVPVHGAITMGQGGLPREGTALKPTLARIRAAAADPRAVGVLLDVDSPGGSALASDLIHHEVERLALKKPVVAHFGEVAASGGYYIGVAAKRIVVQPVGITGSIGVISGKLVAEQLMAQHGVSMQTVRLGPHADMFGVARAWTVSERELLQRELGAIYRGFLEVVARGRRRALSEVEAWAGGRVWSGERALALGLVDRLGGFDVALEELRALLPEIPEARRKRLRPRVVQPPAGPLRPPEPVDAPSAHAVLGALGGLGTLRELVLDADGGALCFAPEVPEFR